MEKNKELTPMQELIEMFTELAEKDGDSGFVGRSVLAIIKNNNYLEKEKQVIEDAYDDGFSTTGWMNRYTYYNTKFNNQIK